MVVKWFKEREEWEREALELREMILSSKIQAACSELLPLEVCRGLVRAGFPGEKVRGASSILNDMADSGFIEASPVSGILKDSEEIVIDLHLYAIDAVTLATSFALQLDLVTEDKHLLKESVIKTARKKGVSVLTLSEMSSQL